MLLPPSLLASRDILENPPSSKGEIGLVAEFVHLADQDRIRLLGR
jgi:hypothetical protein